MSNLKYVVTGESLTVYLDGKPVTVNKSHMQYNAVLKCLKTNDMDGLRTALDVRTLIVEKSRGQVYIENSTVFYNGKPMHNALTRRMLDMMHEGKDIKPLVRFLENLKRNPSMRACEELYLFLDNCELPITPDGYFLAYKMVKSDFTDKYTGKFDNSPGKLVEMERNEVDDIRSNTCSNGLHFASLHYVKNGPYGSRGAGDKLLLVQIDPADVVSIPNDYNNSKGRTCKYYVVQELSWDTEEDEIPSAVDWERDEDKEEEDEENDGMSEWTDADEDGDEENEENEEEEESDVDEDSDTSQPASTKLDASKVRQIRNMLDDDWTLTAIAKAMGISRRQVARIRDGENWAGV